VGPQRNASQSFSATDAVGRLTPATLFLSASSGGALIHAIAAHLQNGLAVVGYHHGQIGILDLAEELEGPRLEL